MQPLAIHGVLPEARPEQLSRHDLGGVSHHPPLPLKQQIPPVAGAGSAQRAGPARSNPLTTVARDWGPVDPPGADL
jgi:hypothetical protein